MKQTLAQDFTLYSYLSRYYSFHTQIQADYLISNAASPVNFVFIIKSNQSDDLSFCDFVCCSAFTQKTRDYRENQRARTLLKKERIHIFTKESVALFDRLNNQE